MPIRYVRCDECGHERFTRAKKPKCGRHMKITFPRMREVPIPRDVEIPEWVDRRDIGFDKWA